MADLIPRLGVADIERELKFFTALGFQTTERSENLAKVELDGARLTLERWETWRVTDRPLLDWDHNPKQFGAGVQLAVNVDSVDEIAARIPIGVPRPWPAQDKPWGLRELTLRSPSGYLITFAERRKR
jgi:catechol 2,3-dioxygenase-like lactoylglutathione lyase family enzyme